MLPKWAITSWPLSKSRMQCFLGFFLKDNKTKSADKVAIASFSQIKNAESRMIWSIQLRSNIYVQYMYLFS